MHLDYTWCSTRNIPKASNEERSFLTVSLKWSWFQIYLLNPEPIHKSLTPGHSLKLHEAKKFCWNKLSLTLLSTLTLHIKLCSSRILAKSSLLNKKKKKIVDFSDKTLSVFISWGSLNLLIRIKLRSRTYTPTLKQEHEKVFFFTSTIIKICAESVFRANREERKAKGRLRKNFGGCICSFNLSSGDMACWRVEGRDVYANCINTWRNSQRHTHVKKGVIKLRGWLNENIWRGKETSYEE